MAGPIHARPKPGIRSVGKLPIRRHHVSRNFTWASKLFRVFVVRGCDVSDKPYSAAKLARRWSVSKSSIYEMVRDGRLKSFRLAGQLLRISAAEVARHEDASNPVPDTHNSQDLGPSAGEGAAHPSESSSGSTL
jgi:excisionase family DNA binding protein